MMKTIWLLLLLLVGLQFARGVQVWVTTLDESRLLSRLGDLSPTNGNSNNANKITINSQTYQEVYGFGAALTESSAINFSRMKQKSSSSYEKTLNSLFDANQGAGLQLLRIPIGSCDFSLSPYFTYDDITNDWLFEKWNWGRDSTYILPVLKDILKINPNIKIMISPWSAPTWMKTSANQSNAFNWGTLGANYYDDFAYYFQVTIQKYKAEGINIYALTLQNEPQNEPSSYPVMRLSAVNESFLAKTLGPKLKDNNINTKIFVWDHNWDDYQYPITVLSDSAAYPFIAGSAFHCYGGSVSSQTNVYNAHPDKEIWFTECSGTGASNFKSNIPWNTQNLYFGAIKNWARTVIHWNIALDGSAGPKASGGCNDCRGVITVNSDYVNVKYNEEYYGMAQISKFLKLPAHRLDCSLQGGGGCVSALCLKNSDNSVVIVVANFCSSSETIAVQNGGSYVQTSVLVGLTTFVW